MKNNSPISITHHPLCYRDPYLLKILMLLRVLHPSETPVGMFCVEHRGSTFPRGTAVGRRTFSGVLHHGSCLLQFHQAGQAAAAARRAAGSGGQQRRHGAPAPGKPT